MKHIKTFESFSINEEESIWGDVKNWAGIKKDSEDSEDSEEREKKRSKTDREKDFLIALKKIEQEVDGATNVIFAKDKLIKQAEENSYRGKLEISPSRSGNNVVVYKPNYTGLQKLASGSGGYRPF